VRDRLTKKEYERLVSALAIVLGWEALVVLEDVRGLDPRTEEDVLRWTVRSLIEAATRDADERRSRRAPT
jgi:hypothetical protein